MHPIDNITHRRRRVGLRCVPLIAAVMIATGCAKTPVEPMLRMPYYPSNTHGYIAGNGGRYMSPFTHDGVIADWVDEAARVMAGKQIGKSAGGISGAVVGDRMGGTLGAVLGRTIGQFIGNASARAASIQAIGGWDFIESTSDISFESYPQMARFLRMHYRKHPHYERAIDMTLEIYPKLGPYIR